MKKLLNSNIPAIKGKKRRKATRLIAEVNIRCNGHLHKIGLASNGQLSIPAHTKEAIKNFQMMTEMGGTGAKCANILQAWQEGSYTSIDIPQDLSLPMRHKSRLAARIQRRLQLKYGWPLYPLEIPVLREYEELGKTSWGSIEYKDNYNPQACIIEKITNTIVKTLVKRGWKCVDDGKSGFNGVITYKYDSESKPYYGRDSNRLLIVSANGSRYHIHNNENVLLSSEVDYEKLNYRLAIDYAEKRIIEILLSKKQKEGLTDSEKDFTADCINKIKLEGNLSNVVVGVNTDSGLAALVISHGDLTPVALQLLLRHYKDTEGRVCKLLKANDKRRTCPNRFPPRPKNNFGSTAKNKQSYGEPNPEDLNYEL